MQLYIKQQVDNVAAGLGQKQSVNFVLRVAQSKITVEVSGQATLVNPGNANTATDLARGTAVALASSEAGRVDRCVSITGERPNSMSTRTRKRVRGDGVYLPRWRPRRV
jgi:hypothetical protein